jgi:hypothetical protein
MSDVTHLKPIEVAVVDDPLEFDPADSVRQALALYNFLSAR